MAPAPHRAGPRQRSVWSAALVGLLVFGSGCAGTPERGAPPVTVPADFTGAGEAPVPPQWWLLFDDPTLDGLVQRALSQSLTIESAWQRVEQSRAVARREGAELLPSVDFNASLDYDFAPAPRDGLSFGVGFLARYEIDVWGRVRSGRDAALLDLMSRQDELTATAISLSAEIASAWYVLVELRGQMELLESQLEANERVLELIELRSRLGRAGASDLLRQRQLVEGTRSEILRLGAETEVQLHTLALLLGEPPSAELPSEPSELVAAPPLPDTGLPAALVQRRPDVRAALRRVEAADKRLAVAIADRFPRLSLSASATTSTEPDTLFVDWLGNLSANLLAPLFDGGARAAEVDRTRAVVAEVLSEYGDAVLVALAEVEDALSRDRYQTQIVESLEVQVELAREGLRRAGESYERGAVDFITVLDALTNHQRLQRTLLSSRRDLLLFRIDLCRALAGGWDVQRPQSLSAGTIDAAAEDAP